MQEHLRYHTGKTWDCAICAKKFARNEHLTRHIQAKHENVRFTCSHCGKCSVTRVTGSSTKKSVVAVALPDLHYVQNCWPLHTPWKECSAGLAVVLSELK